jgi:FkbH-like protein
MEEISKDISGFPMMPNEFVRQLALRRIYLWSEGVSLKFKAPEGAVDETMKQAISFFKGDLIKALQKRPGYLLISPLSYNQKSLFFMHLLEPDSAAYNIALSMKLHSQVEMEKMRVALEVTGRRHGMLRTTYSYTELKDAIIPVQFIHEDLPPSVETINAADWTEDELKERVQEFYKRPFDLEKGPMVRAGLFFRGEKETVLAAVFHHISMDAWSLNIIMRDLAAACSGAEEDASGLPASSQYTEFVLAQHRDLEEPAGMSHLEHWLKMHRSPAPPPVLVPESRRPALRRSKGATHYFNLGPEFCRKIESEAQKQGITSFALLLAVFQWFIFERSGQRDVTIGIPVMARKDRRFEGTVGYFINPVPLRSTRSGTPSFYDHARTTALELRTAIDHRDAPFAAIVERLGGVRDTAHTPVFQIMFNMLSHKTLGEVIELLYPMERPLTVDFGGLNATAYALDQQEGQFDMTLELIDFGDRILGLWKYCTDLFTSSEALDMISAFQARLEAALESPERPLFATSGQDVISPTPDKDTPVVAVSATFTAEVLQEFLEFWFQRLGWRNEVRFAQYNQVFQELLNPSSLLRSNRLGHNIVMVRIDDLLDAGSEGQLKDIMEMGDSLSKILDDLLNALTAAVQSMQAPLFFVLCPSSPASEEILRLKSGMIEKFLEALRSLPGVTVITHEDISRHYPVPEYYEHFGHTIGRVPFTRQYLAALATSVARSMHSLSHKPVKALVVDCDGTLWRGVSAEDGATGVFIGPLQRDFQKFLIEQYQAGIVLCLCSKNQEADVWAVFDRHPDMLLKREHFTFWKINWEPKSSNIQALASEINIGLDAIALLDDSPMERAEVNSNCPAVFCLEFPEAWEERTRWLKNLWALDHGRVTKEDKIRQEHYRSEQLRENIKKSAGSLLAFLEKLELRIDINAAEPADYERLTQLSVRTNQFNTTTLRLTLQEVVEYAENPAKSAHITRVRDRFGDYGLVGGMFATASEGVLCVDGMFLSCRALGRGVEYRMAAYLSAIAQKAGCTEVAFPVRTTDRNEPARNYLTRLKGLLKGTVDDAGTLKVKAEQLAAINLKDAIVPAEEIEETVPKEISDKVDGDLSRVREVSVSIAGELNSVEAILDAVEKRTREKQGRIPVSKPAAAAAPVTATERVIAEIWKRVLGLADVSTNAKFFEVGGTSLLMVRIAIELKNNHNLEVSIMDMFQYPSIADLAKHLDQGGQAVEVESRAAEAAVRQREALSLKNLAAQFKRLKKSRE